MLALSLHKNCSCSVLVVVARMASSSCRCSTVSNRAVKVGSNDSKSIWVCQSCESTVLLAHWAQMTVSDMEHLHKQLANKLQKTKSATVTAGDCYNDGSYMLSMFFVLVLCIACDAVCVWQLLFVLACDAACGAACVCASLRLTRRSQFTR